MVLGWFCYDYSDKHISLPAPLLDGDHASKMVLNVQNLLPHEWLRAWNDGWRLPILLEGEDIAVWFELMSEEQVQQSRI